MVDNIKLNKVLPSLSSTSRVKRTDQKDGNDQHHSFEEVLKKKRKKKKRKDDSELAGITNGDNSGDDGQSALHASTTDVDEKEKSAESPPSRIIDIRV